MLKKEAAVCFSGRLTGNFVFTFSLFLLNFFKTFFLNFFFFNFFFFFFFLAVKRIKFIQTTFFVTLSLGLFPLELFFLFFFSYRHHFADGKMSFFETELRGIDENDTTIPAEVIQLSAAHTGFSLSVFKKSITLFSFLTLLFF